MRDTTYSIAEVERHTGLSRDTLRVWERRYGFPSPRRNQRGERLYDAFQLERLRLIRQLLDSGLRPGTLMGLDERHLRHLMAERVPPSPSPPLVEELLGLLAGSSPEAVTLRMEEMLADLGLQKFVTGVVAPLCRAVGEAWSAGRLGVLDEHFCSALVTRLLNGALCGLPRRSDGARVLLTTLPGEQHGLGVLMVACILALEGAQVLALGVQTPLEEIVRGAREDNCGIVAVSCSLHMERRDIAGQLVKLRRMLPHGVSIWVGGGGAARLVGVPVGVRRIDDLDQIAGALDEDKLLGRLGRKES